MTLPPKLEKLLENWPAKIISLVAAILVYAFYQISTLDTRYFVVPLEIQQDSGMVATNTSEPSVRIAIRGKQTDITTLETKDFMAFADMNRYINEGTVVVPVQLELSDNARIMKDVEISLQPETVEVTLEKEVSAYIPVKPAYAGKAAHGYEIESVEAVPSMIKVRGPQNIVENIDCFDTDAILVDGITGNASYETELLGMNASLTYEHEGPVIIDVSVIPSKMKRTLNNLPISLAYASETLIVEYEKKTATCTVSGNELDVEKFNPADDFIYVDCSDITEPGEYDIPLMNRRAYPLTVESLAPESVHVVVTEKPVEEIEEVEE